MSPLARYACAAVPARWADGGAATALALLALDRGGSALAGMLIAALNLPHAIAGPFVGRWADRSRSPRHLYAAVLLAFAAGTAGVALTSGHAPAAVPVALALAAGTLGPLLTGGLSGLLVGLVAPDDLPRAHAVDAATYNVAGLAAPASVAAVAGLASPRWAALVLAAVVAAAAGMVLTLPVRAAREPAPHRGPAERRRVRDVLAGPLVGVARVVWERPVLRMTTVATTLSHLADGGLTLAAALLATQLGHSAAAGGLLLSGFALGALLGSLAMNWPAARRLPAPAAVLGSLVALGALLALAAAAPTFPLALCCVAAAGFFDGPLLAATLTVRGGEAPEGMRAEVFTTTASLKISAGALGAAATGWVAGLDGVSGRELLLAVSAGTLLSALAGWLVAGRPPLHGRHSARAGASAGADAARSTSGGT